jgi:hypothetical protein
MKPLNQFLKEARSNPDLNPKTSINNIMADYLKSAGKIVRMKNAFVSFTEIEKLGINPNSPYKTPLGIYAYSLEYVMNEVGSNKPMRNLPFAGHSLFANLFSLKRNILIFDDTFDEKQESLIYEKIHNKFPKHEKIINEIISDANKFAKIRTPAGRLWYVVKELVQGHPSKWNKLFRRLGIDAVYDNGNGIIHMSEPDQLVVFNPREIKNIKRVYNKYSPIEMNMSKDFSFALNHFAKENDFDSFWNTVEKIEKSKGLTDTHILILKALDKKAFANLLNYMKKNDLIYTPSEKLLISMVHDSTINQILKDDQYIELFNMLSKHSNTQKAKHFLNGFWITEIVKSKKIFNRYIQVVENRLETQKRFIRQFLKEDITISDDVLELLLFYIFEIPLDDTFGGGALELLQTNRVKRFYFKINKNQKLLSVIRNFYDISNIPAVTTIEKVIQILKNPIQFIQQHKIKNEINSNIS